VCLPSHAQEPAIETPGRLGQAGAADDGLPGWSAGVAPHGSPPDDTGRYSHGGTPTAVDRSQSLIVIDIPETQHPQRERSRLHAHGRRTDDNTVARCW
jgi:hypothetical protein